MTLVAEGVGVTTAAGFPDASRRGVAGVKAPAHAPTMTSRGLAQ